MIFKKTMAFLLAAVLLLSTAGCGSAPAAISASSEAASVSSSTSESAVSEEEAEEDAEDAFIKKYNAYIDVSNFIVGELSSTAASYFQRVAPQEEFQLARENGDFWCEALGGYEDILEAAHTASAEEPAIAEMDAAFEALYPSLKVLADGFEGVYRYADFNSVADDNDAKAKELHAAIWKSYNEFVELVPAFMDALNDMSEQQRRASLQQYLDDDMPVHYTLLALVLDAQEIQQIIYDQGITDETVIQLDLTEVQPLYDDFAQKTEEALNYIRNDEDAFLKEGFHSVNFTGFAYNLKETKTVLTDLVQRVKDQVALESYQIGSPQNFNGTIAKFDQQLEKLIDSYNML